MDGIFRLFAHVHSAVQGESKTRRFHPFPALRGSVTVCDMPSPFTSGIPAFNPFGGVAGFLGQYPHVISIKSIYQSISIDPLPNATKYLQGLALIPWQGLLAILGPLGAAGGFEMG